MTELIDTVSDTVINTTEDAYDKLVKLGRQLGYFTTIIAWVIGVALILYGIVYYNKAKIDDPVWKGLSIIIINYITTYLVTNYKFAAASQAMAVLSALVTAILVGVIN